MNELVHTVAIIDDDLDHMTIMCAVISSVDAEARVEAITNPREAESRVHGLPDGALVLIDRMLGSTESYPLVSTLHADRPDLRLVVMSAALMDVDAERALSAGACAALEKPGSLDGWRRLVCDLMGLAQPAKPSPN